MWGFILFLAACVAWSQLAAAERMRKHERKIRRDAYGDGYADGWNQCRHIVYVRERVLAIERWDAVDKVCRELLG